MKLPEGWTAGAASESNVAGYKQTDFNFTAPDGGGPNHVRANVYYRDAGKGDYEAGLTMPKLDADQAVTDKVGKGIEQEGNVAKGTGKYFVYRDVNHNHVCMVHLLRGETHVVVTFKASADKGFEPAQLDACKSTYMP